MHKSDASTRISAPDGAAPASTRRLVELGPGPRLRIVRLPAGFQHGLEQEGLTEGLEVEVERRVALGGPVIVRAGRARIAIARSVASGIVVEPSDPPAGAAAGLDGSAGVHA